MNTFCCTDTFTINGIDCINSFPLFSSYCLDFLLQVMQTSIEFIFLRLTFLSHFYPFFAEYDNLRAKVELDIKDYKVIYSCIAFLLLFWFLFPPILCSVRDVAFAQKALSFGSVKLPYILCATKSSFLSI